MKPPILFRDLILPLDNGNPKPEPLRIRTSEFRYRKWVSPFGNLWVKVCSQLTTAYRSVPRPSSPVYAKASTNCPYLTLENPHHHRQACLACRTSIFGGLVCSDRSRLKITIEPTQLDNHCCARRAPLPFGRRTARSKEAHAATASISRTHSQCQREGRTPRVHAGGPA